MPFFYTDPLHDDDNISKLLTAICIGDTPPLPTPTAACSTAAACCPGAVVSNDGDRNHACISNANNPESVLQQARSTTSLAGSLDLAAQVPLTAHLSLAAGPRLPVHDWSPSANTNQPGEYILFHAVQSYPNNCANSAYPTHSHASK
jgi:hypothetical protein